MTDWIEIFRIEHEKAGIKKTTIISINLKLKDDKWYEQITEAFKKIMAL